jgi:hypothetical protein
LVRYNHFNSSYQRIHSIFCKYPNYREEGSECEITHLCCEWYPSSWVFWKAEANSPLLPNSGQPFFCNLQWPFPLYIKDSTLLFGSLPFSYCNLTSSLQFSVIPWLRVFWTNWSRSAETSHFIENAHYSRYTITLKCFFTSFFFMLFVFDPSLLSFMNKILLYSQVYVFQFLYSRFSYIHYPDFHISRSTQSPISPDNRSFTVVQLWWFNSYFNIINIYQNTLGV